MRVLLVSTYELGRQPFGLASPAAWLSRAGFDVSCLDMAKQTFQPDEAVRAGLVAFHLPMHTATRLAGPVIARVKTINPAAHVCAYGLYAPLNAAWLEGCGVDTILGGEFEADLVELASSLAQPGRIGRSQNTGRPQSHREHRARDVGSAPAAPLPKLRFLVPDRTGLPPLSRYATLDTGRGERRTAGYTEASRGCRHLCRHCPVVPVYQGQFRVVQREVVLADIARQVEAGAQHITFGDPDFFNGPSHALQLVESLARAHPGVTYDVTIKVEHLLKHRDLLTALVATGCLFITSAVESLDDRVLALLDKGHCRRDFVEAVDACRAANVALSPTFVAFHPWLSLEAYCEFLDVLADLDLVAHVAPIQLAIRLLVTRGSRLLELPEIRGLVGAFDAGRLIYPWAHPDPRVDDLARDVGACVAPRTAPGAPRADVFEAVSALAHERAGLARRQVVRRSLASATAPAFDEPWYCCAEPTPEQVAVI